MGHPLTMPRQTVKRHILCLLLASFLPGISLPATLPKGDSHMQALYDQHPWSLMYYYGVTVNNPLIQVLTFNHLNRWPEHIQSIEMAKTLNKDNFLRKIVSPLVGVVQLAFNLTVRNGSDQHTIYEFDPYLIFRWANLPWNKILTTSFALAEGLSYDSSIPAIEKRENDNTKRLLNYLMFEATFALPPYPRLQ